MAGVVADHLGKDLLGPASELAMIGEAEVVWQFGDHALEYEALRSGAGLIDVSAGGPLRLSGLGAVDTLQAALARDVEFLLPERARSSIVLDSDGGVIDVVTVVAGETDYFVLTGPGQAGRVEAALRAAATADVEIENWEGTTGIFAVEGPQAWRVVADVLGSDYVSLAYESSLPVEIDGSEALIARVGVTGEYGYTFVAPFAVAGSLWQQFAAHGGSPVGHRARETAMFEVRQPIVHRELSEEDTVITAGLNWLVDPSKEEFVGRAALLEHARSGGPIRPIGFLVEDGVTEVGDIVYVGAEEIGRIAYLTSSPGVGAELGLAKVLQEWQASRLEFTTAAGARIRTLAPPYVVPKSWTTAVEV